MTNSLTDWLTDSITDWLIQWLTDSPIDWLAHSLACSLACSFACLLTHALNPDLQTPSDKHNSITAKTMDLMFTLLNLLCPKTSLFVNCSSSSACTMILQNVTFVYIWISFFSLLPCKWRFAVYGYGFSVRLGQVKCYQGHFLLAWNVTPKSSCCSPFITIRRLLDNGLSNNL